MANARHGSDDADHQAVSTRQHGCRTCSGPTSGSLSIVFATSESGAALRTGLGSKTFFVMNPLVCQTIRDRRALRFYYDGGIRDVEPHVHGFGRDGSEFLRGYHVSATADRGNALDGRCSGSIRSGPWQSAIAHSHRRVPATIRTTPRCRRFIAASNAYASGFVFSSESCSLMNARISSVIASSFVHCSL